jgi:hypothetical protein
MNVGAREPWLMRGQVQVQVQTQEQKVLMRQRLQVERLLGPKQQEREKGAQVLWISRQRAVQELLRASRTRGRWGGYRWVGLWMGGGVPVRGLGSERLWVVRGRRWWGLPRWEEG